jgi:hypothetical protein
MWAKLYRVIWIVKDKIKSIKEEKANWLLKEGEWVGFAMSILSMVILPVVL